MNYPSPIEQAEKEIQRDKDDLKRLKKRYPGYDFVPVDKAVAKAPQSQTRPLSYLDTAVEWLISNSLQEWTSRAVVKELSDQGRISFNSEEVAMNAVGSALSSLTDAGKIRRVHKGRGRDPHRYCSVSVQAAETLQPEVTKEEAADWSKF